MGNCFKIPGARPETHHSKSLKKKKAIIHLLLTQLSCLRGT